MSDFDNLKDEVNSLAQGFIDESKCVKAKDLDLDERAGYKFWIQNDNYQDESNYIACRKNNQGTLEYYGGFSYVDKKSVFEIGEYVFYLATDNRVAGHIDRFWGNQDLVRQLY